MAIIIECDGGCGKISPDKEKRHIANHWITLTITDPYGLAKTFEQVKVFVLCEDCYDRVDKALKEKGE